MQTGAAAATSTHGQGTRHRLLQPSLGGSRTVSLCRGDRGFAPLLTGGIQTGAGRAKGLTPKRSTGGQGDQAPSRAPAPPSHQRGGRSP